MHLSGKIKTNSHILLSISLFNEDQTGLGFAGIIDFILSEPNIEKITLQVADTLQKYHLQLQPNINNIEIAEEKAIEKRQEWEKNNKITLEKLYNSNKYVKTIFWNDVLKLNKFKDYRIMMDQFYEHSGNFRFAHHVDSLATNFSRKTLQMLDGTVDINTIINAEKLYCLEECAGVVALSHDYENKYDYEIYAGERNRPMKAAYKKYGCSSYMHSIAILKENNNSLSKTMFFPPPSSDKNLLEFHYNKNGISLDLSIQSLDLLNKETIQALTTLVALIQMPISQNIENNSNSTIKSSETRDQNVFQH